MLIFILPKWVIYSFIVLLDCLFLFYLGFSMRIRIHDFLIGNRYGFQGHYSDCFPQKEYSLLCLCTGTVLGESVL